jgi:tRNA(Ile)-lysidine synthase
MRQEPLTDRIRHLVEEQRMLPAPATAAAPVVLMVSGGSDSVALMRMLPQLYPQYHYTVLHINHLLRGEDADKDERFVLDLAHSCGLKVESRRIDVGFLAAQSGGNLEEVGREQRYLAANELLDRLCAQRNVAAERGRIAVAHTLDDRAETFLMRIIVGGGGSGLSSIPFTNGRIIRPLLDCTREELREWLKAQVGGTVSQGQADDGTSPQITDGTAAQQGIGDGAPPQTTVPFSPLWREDASNEDTSRLRAFVRHELLPLARTRNPYLARNIARSLDVLSAEDALLARFAEELEGRFVSENEGSFEYPGPIVTVDTALFDEERALARRVIRVACKRVMPATARITFEHIENIVANGRHIGFATDIPGDVTVRNVCGTLVIRQKTATEKPKHDPNQRNSPRNGQRDDNA